MSAPRTGLPSKARDRHARNVLSADDIAKRCDKIIECGKKGFTWHEVCVEIGISYRHLLSQCNPKDEAYKPEIAEACKTADEYARAWWDRQARERLIESPKSRKLNTALWARVMAGRWRFGVEEPDSGVARRELPAVNVTVNVISAEPARVVIEQEPIEAEPPPIAPPREELLEKPPLPAIANDVVRVEF